MFSARPLAGLPAYGPSALSFPKPNAFSEGYVVEFTLGEDASWIGNFEITERHWLSAVYTDLGPRTVLVVAGGTGYFVDAINRRVVQQFGADIRHCWFQPELRAFVIGGCCDFNAFDGERILWSSRRIALDGMRNVRRTGMTATGEAYDLDDEWPTFEISLANGNVAGGSRLWSG